MIYLLVRWNIFEYQWAYWAFEGGHAQWFQRIICLFLTLQFFPAGQLIMPPTITPFILKQVGCEGIEMLVNGTVLVPKLALNPGHEPGQRQPARVGIRAERVEE